MDACHVHDLSDQGVELKRSMQDGIYNSAASVLDHSWFTEVKVL